MMDAIGAIVKEMQMFTMCPFFPKAKAWIRVGLKEIALAKGEYKLTGVTLSTEVSARAYDILLGRTEREVGVPDAAYNRRRWVIII